MAKQEKLLIALPKKSAKSFGLDAVSQDGIFCFSDGRYLKVFEAGENAEQVFLREKLAEKITSEIRFTTEIRPKEEQVHMTLTVYADDFCHAKDALDQDAGCIGQYIKLSAYGMDETLKAVRREDGSSFLLSKAIRTKKDLKKEVLGEFTAEKNRIKKDGACISAVVVRQFPKTAQKGIAGIVNRMGIDAIRITDISCDKESFVRWPKELEKYYGERADEKEHLINLSEQIILLSDSAEMADIAENALIGALKKEGFEAEAAGGFEKTICESALSFGFIDTSFDRVEEAGEAYGYLWA